MKNTIILLLAILMTSCISLPNSYNYDYPTQVDNPEQVDHKFGYRHSYDYYNYYFYDYNTIMPYIPVIIMQPPQKNNMPSSQTVTPVKKTKKTKKAKRK